MKVGALGVRRAILKTNSRHMALLGDVSSLNLTTKGSGLARGLESNSHQLRFAIEGSITKKFLDNFSITPFGELGLRNDFGDGSSVSGLEVGGGLRFSTSALDVEARGRWFEVRARDDLHEYSYSLSATYDLHRDGLGLTFEVNPSVGCNTAQSSKGLLYSPSTLYQGQPQVPCNSKKSLNTTLGYGKLVFGDRVTFRPQATLETYRNGLTRTGVTALLTNNASFSLQGTIETTAPHFDFRREGSTLQFTLSGSIQF